jgi:hypothetical protein
MVASTGGCEEGRLKELYTCNRAAVTGVGVRWTHLCRGRARSIPIPSCRCDGVRGACVRSRLGVAAALASPCRQAHPHLCSAHAALSRPWLARVPTRSSVARVPYVHERAGFRP